MAFTKYSASPLRARESAYSDLRRTSEFVRGIVVDRSELWAAAALFPFSTGQAAYDAFVEVSLA